MYTVLYTQNLQLLPPKAAEQANLDGSFQALRAGQI